MKRQEIYSEETVGNHSADCYIALEFYNRSFTIWNMKKGCKRLEMYAGFGYGRMFAIKAWGTKGYK
jgi:hypothetical protein